MAARTSTDVNRSRERAKQEAASLRATVAQLEAELEQIRAQHEAAHVLAVASAGDASVRAQAIENAAWQVMAERQRRLRYDAEVENSKLRSGLEDLLRVGRALEKLLHRRQHADVESMLERRPGNPNRMTTQSLLDDPTIVGDLKANLASQFSDAHNVFMNESFTRDDGPFRHINVRCQGEVGTYVEVSERRILPFDEQIISAALLQHFKAQHPGAASGPVPEVWACGESVEYDFTTMIDTVRFRGVTRTKILVQRVGMGGATFFFFAGIADPGESLGASSCQGLYVRHHGWTRLRAVPQPKDAPLGSTITEYTNYHVATPELYDVAQDQRRRIGTLTNYVLATLGYQLDGVRESVDNYALAYSMASPPSSLGVSFPNVQTLVSQ